MKKPYLGNSIYQQKGAPMGLSVTDGMMINNRPDGQTGIQQAAQIRKMMKKAEKVSTMAEAISLGKFLG
jgi:hypothetical protein